MVTPLYQPKIVDGAVQIIAPTTAEQRLAKKNKLKARADLEEQSLDDLFNNSKIYEAEVKGSSTSSQNTHNIAFVSSNNTDSTNELVNAVLSVSTASSKATVSTLPNVDSLSDAVIYSFFASQSNSPQLDNEDLKQIDPDDLKKIDLKWQMAMLIMRARRECRSPRDNRHKEATKRPVPIEVSTSNALVSQCDVVGGYDWSFQAEEEPTNYAFMAHASSGSLSFSGLDNESQVSDKTGLGFDSQVFNSQVFDYEEVHSHESDNIVPKIPKNDRYKTGEGYHDVPPSYTGTFMPLKPNLVFNDAPTASESVANVFNVESSTDKPSKNMSKTLWLDVTIVEDWISDSEDETKNESVPKQREPSFVPISKHVKTSREYVKKVEHPKQANNLRTNNQKSRGHKKNRAKKAYFVCRSLNHLIKDYDYYENKWYIVPTAVLTRSRLVSLNAARPVPTAVPQSTVKSPRPVKHVVNKGTKGNADKASANWVWKPKYPIQSWLGSQKTLSFLFDVQGNPQQALKDKEINEGYVAFRGNPKGGKISDTECVVLSSDYKLPDENHVLLRVPRENNMYNVDLKNVIPSEDLTCLFAKAIFDESNLWHRRLGHINFKTMNKLVKFYEMKGIKREFSVARTPQQNRIAERKNRALIKATRTMLADLLLPGNPPRKFDGKVEGFLVGYSVNSKAFRVFNSRTRIVQKTLHINFLENKPNVVGIGPKWLFDINTLIMSVNYQLVVAGNQPNDNACIKENLDAYDDVANAAFDVKENENDVHVSANGSVKTSNKKHDEKAKRDDKRKRLVDLPTRVRDLRAECEEFFSNCTNRVNDVTTPITAARRSLFVDPFKCLDDPDMPELEDIVYSDDEEDVGAEADLSNLETIIHVSPITTTRVHKDHLVNQIIGDLNSAPQTRSMTRMVREQGGLHQIIDEDFHTYMFACFLSQEEPKKVHQVIKDLSWIEAMQEELLQFKLQKVWVLVDLPKGKRAIGSKWVFRNKKDERGIVIRNKAKLVAQGHTQEEGIKYDKVFAPVARIEAIRVKIDQTLFIKKQKGDFLLVQVYVDDIIFGSTNKELCKAFERLMKDKFQMSSMGELTFFLGLLVKQKDDGIFISQDKYVAEILRKFGFTDVKSDNTPIETEKPLLKDPDGEDVNVHIYSIELASPKQTALGKDISNPFMAEQVQERHLDNIRKYQSLKKKPVRPIFEREYKKVQTLFKPDKDVKEPKKKRFADETLLQESFKKLKAAEVSGYESTEEIQPNDPKEIEDLIALWNLVKEKFSSAVPSVDTEKALWVELKRLFEPDADDVLWKLQRHMHYPLTWKLYTDCGVHQVSLTTRRHDMFMMTEKDYPLSNAVMISMLSGKLQVEEDNEMVRDLVMKIFMEANKPKSRNLKKMHQGINAAGSSITAAGPRLMLLDKVDTTAEVLKNLL
uniref:Uncharacterized protein n=1 Tax=Tanacetum cinerariifolium TaxID=118510 RepID=A0A6L2KNP8_TANCI|nr:hypothetical protein [Tanacetum cinerariifolium]